MIFIIAHIFILFLMKDSFLGFKAEELSKINEKKTSIYKMVEPVSFISSI